jgi:hypothetical protein
MSEKCNTERQPPLDRRPAICQRPGCWICQLGRDHVDPTVVMSHDDEA